jgi:hypothetical protein
MCTPFPYRGSDSGARAGWGNVPSVPGGSGKTRGHYEPCGMSQTSGPRAFHWWLRNPAGGLPLQSGEGAVHGGSNASSGPGKADAAEERTGVPKSPRKRAQASRSLRLSLPPREAIGSSIPSIFLPHPVIFMR